MKTVASLAFGIASSIGACIAASSVASAIMGGSQAHEFDTSPSPDLWTSSPVRVDVAKQGYERIPASHSSYVTDAAKVRIAINKPEATTKELESVKPTLSAEHLSWCGSRYRSYDPASNSYRAYSGQTKTCMSPYAALEATRSETAQAGSDVAVYAAVAWCAARYQSYRASDNSYQPYSGRRRTCVPPDHQEMASAR